MRWPWTSTARLADAHAEIERLREQNGQLIDSLTRISRREAGLPETPREPRPRLEPMPIELKEYIEKFATPSIRKEMRTRYYRRHGAGEAWARIMDDVMLKEEEDDDG